MKDELRRILAEERRNISDPLHRKFSAKIAERLVSLEAFRNADTILCYASKRYETATDRIFKYCFKCGKSIAAPVCIGKHMIFRIVRSKDDFEPGRFSVYEPKISCAPAVITAETVCITPALCYDKNGFRIGYGGGYYDRFFSENECIRIGVCYEQFIRDFVHDENDESVDAIISQDSVRIIKSDRSPKWLRVTGIQ